MLNGIQLMHVWTYYFTTADPTTTEARYAYVLVSLRELSARSRPTFRLQQQLISQR